MPFPNPKGVFTRDVNDFFFQQLGYSSEFTAAAAAKFSGGAFYNSSTSGKGVWVTSVYGQTFGSATPVVGLVPGTLGVLCAVALPADPTAPPTPIASYASQVTTIPFATAWSFGVNNGAMVVWPGCRMFRIPSLWSFCIFAASVNVAISAAISFVYEP